MSIDGQNQQIRSLKKIHKAVSQTDQRKNQYINK